MLSYLQHLLQDIHNAHRESQELGTVEAIGIDDMDTHFQKIDHWISGDSEQTLSYYCGLKREEFPPAAHFLDKEIKQVCEAFEKMLASWGATIDMPQTLPLFKRYELMVGLLDQKFTPLEVGTFVFDFCTGYATDCELGEYCSCLEYWKEE